MDDRHNDSTPLWGPEQTVPEPESGTPEVPRSRPLSTSRSNDGGPKRSRSSDRSDAPAEIVMIDAPAQIEESVETRNDDADPFSPQNLALAQTFAEMTETKRLLTTVRVGKPNKEAFVRTSPDPNHWIVGSVLELKDQGDETYWLMPTVRDALIGEPCMKAVRLILAVDRPGNPFFWKIGLPDPSGRSQPWVDSMVEAATVAKSKWVRVSWSTATRGYEVLTAEIKAEPKWPTESIKDLLNIAFRGRVVSSLDHPVLRALRGQD